MSVSRTQKKKMNVARKTEYKIAFLSTKLSLIKVSLEYRIYQDREFH